ALGGALDTTLQRDSPDALDAYGAVQRRISKQVVGVTNGLTRVATMGPRLRPELQGTPAHDHLPDRHTTFDSTGRGGRSANEPRPSRRRNAAVVTRNEGRPRPPKRGSSATRPRARSVSMTPLLSVARMWLSARVTGCS